MSQDDGRSQTDDEILAGDKPIAIGGWLWVWVINFISSLLSIPNLIRRFLAISEIGGGLTQPLMALDYFVDVAFLALLIYAATRFFRKKRDFPTLITRLLVARCIALTALFAITLISGWSAYASQRLVGTVLITAIWVRYFEVSKRVKATFVVP